MMTVNSAELACRIKEKAARNFNIQGVVTWVACRRPLAGFNVRAFDKDNVDEDDYLGERQTY